MAAPAKPKRIQKLCTLWTHDFSFSAEEVVINIDRFSELDLHPASLAQIIPITQGTSVRDFVHEAPKRDHLLPSKRDGTAVRMNRRNSSTAVTLDESGSFVMTGKDTDEQRSYVFVAKDASSEMKQRYPNLQISIAQSVAAVFGYRSRMNVLVATADEEENSASHVELTFRDEYLARGDMWRLAISELSQRTVYKDQKLLFLGTVKATVKNVYINGLKKRSGYFSATTKPIYRSESARYTLFIQMSKEMWDFDSEGAGEIMFNKVINGFLPELFKNWMSINAHHLVSIILFARLEYREEQDQHNFSEHVRHHGQKDGFRDYYRVVASEMASNDWIKILYQLKKEFRSFLRDISVVPEPPRENENPKYAITGRLCRAPQGNILEAINLASAQFSRDYIDRDLVRTGISIVVITAGTGVYEVDYDMLKLTTDTLMSSGIGIDLVCLSPMPLHSVPLFMYRNPRVLESTVPTAVPSPIPSASTTPRQHDLNLRKLPSGTSSTRYRNKSVDLIPGEWSYAIPHWVDVSFWNGTADEQAMLLRNRKPTRRSNRSKQKDRTFTLRCQIYELQMMGLMENEMTNISVSKLHDHPLHPWHQLRHQITGHAITKETESRIRDYEKKWMDDYDDYIFRPAEERQAVEETARKRIQKYTLEHSKLTTETIGHTRGVSADLAGGLSSSYRPGTSGFLEWRMKEKEKAQGTPTPHPMMRQPSVGSFASNTTAETSASRTTSLKLSRQFSFGGSPFATTKAAVSTGIDPAWEHPVNRPTFVKDLGAQTPSRNSMSSKVSEQIKAALTRSASKTTTPSRPINIGLTKPGGKAEPPDTTLSSTETFKSLEEKEEEEPQTVRDADAGPGLFTTSTLRKYAPYLSSSAEGTPIPQTLSLTRALAPWLVLVNPCNPRKNNFNVNSQFRKWQHVFPRQRRIGSIRWKSLCSPASVPLTNDYFPTAEQLATEYHESPYHLSQDGDDDMSEAPKTRENLIRELIAFRLSHGFQLIVGDAVAEFLGSKSDDLAHIFDKNYMVRDGTTVFMSVGSAIHQLLCGSDGTVEIRRFNRKPAAEYESFEATNALDYRPLIRTALASGYEQREVSFRPQTMDYNWNVIDRFIAGDHSEFSGALRYWRARFILIPVDIPSHGHGPRRHHLATVTEDTPEEIRLEGIRKLTQIWQRNRVLPPEERIHQMQRQKDPNPLAIEYQTRDPSIVIAAGADSTIFADNDPVVLAENESHNTKNIDLPRLAQDLQGERGIKMMDRRWHLRLHYNCFVGSDLTSWLLLNFEDVETREEAVELGNTLMEKGLFQHVQKKHQFRDGNFFFHIGADYRAARPESRMGGWFGNRRGLASVPPTPSSEAPRSALGQRPGSRSSTGSSSSDDQSGEKTPTKPTERRKVNLSSMLRYDVDSRKKSYRREIINLHYDRLHNPDNCYHIRIDWMNVTAKFIEDSIVFWAQSVERYGLKLVEIPIAEADTIVEDHPFRSPYVIKLALAPPTSPSVQVYDTTSFSAVPKQDRFAYHKALLKKLHFVLDIESASSFPTEVDVMYSWGKPDYKFTQYVHRSGILLAQITDEGDFLVLANRLYHDRTAGRRESGRIDTHERQFDRRPIAHYGGLRGRQSPMSSPVYRPLHEPASGAQDKMTKQTAEDIKDELEAFCHNVNLLKVFYAEQHRPRASPSPQTTPVIDSSVPELTLPPRIPLRGISPLPPLSK